MATDFDVNDERDIEVDFTGDFSTVTGTSDIRQQFVNALFRGHSEADMDLIDQNSAENLRIAIRRELRQLSYAEDFEISTELEHGEGIIVTIEADVIDEVVERVVSP
jgi:hypothetical protein